MCVCACVCVCVRDGRPGPISLVVAANTPWPPQSLQEGTSLLPQLPQIKGSFVIWLHHPCPPLPALKIQSPFLTSHSPAPYPLPLPVCRGSSTDLLLSLPQGSLVVLSSVSFAYGLPKSIHGSGPVLVGSVLFCPVIHSSGFYPGESLPLRKSWLFPVSPSPLSLSPLQQAPPPIRLPDLACLSFIASVSQLPISRLILGTAYRPSPAPLYSLLSSALLYHTPPRSPTSPGFDRIVRANQRLEPRERSPISVDFPSSRIVAGVELRCKLGPSLRPLHIHPAPATLSPSRRNQQ